MRILHLVDSGGVYGAERVLLYLAREQHRLGHEPVIGSISKPGLAETEFEAFAKTWPARIVKIRMPRLPGPATMRSLLSTVRQLAPDVLHSHGYKPNILLGLLPRRTRGPMLSTLHGWTGTSEWNALRLYEMLDRRALRRVDVVVAVSRAMAHAPALRALGSRLRMIENGIPAREQRLADLAERHARPLPPELLQAARAQPTLLAVGRLSPEKGFNLLIEAFYRHRRAGGRFGRLVIVGDGPQRPQLQAQLATLGLADAVALPGYVEGPDRLLEQAAGFVMSSLTEGMPMALLEAIQWPRPVLATSVGEIPQILQGSPRAVLVAPNSVDELVGGLERLQSLPPTAPARDDLAARYTAERMALEYDAAYRDAVHGS